MTEILEIVDNETGYDKTYEFFFNLSQIYLKEGQTSEAFSTLSKAQKLAEKDGSYKDDQVRFKVQEMHFLNELYNQFSQIEYSANNQKTWFEFSKTIRNNILIELNINALGEVYNLNTQMFKDIIGSLNWKKFAERIKT
jgi:hypothetical protein